LVLGPNGAYRLSTDDPLRVEIARGNGGSAKQKKHG
jgi:hypothetical protein